MQCPSPGEHIAVQARIFADVREACLAYVPCGEMALLAIALNPR